MGKEIIEITPEIENEFNQWLSYVRIKVGYKKIDLIRKISNVQEKVQQMHENSIENQMIETTHSFHQSWEFQLEQPGLIEAISQLTELQQEVVWRVYVLGESQKEVAIEMGISAAAVSKTKNRAINSLKEKMESKEFFN